MANTGLLVLVHGWPLQLVLCDEYCQDAIAKKAWCSPHTIYSQSEDAVIRIRTYTCTIYMDEYSVRLYSSYTSKPTLTPSQPSHALEYSLSSMLSPQRFRS